MGSPEEEWDAVWGKNSSPLNSLVNVGRKVYNHFFLRMLLEDVDSNTEFLELGCGTSTLIRLLAPSVRHVTGIDISDNALELSRRNCRGIANICFIKDDCLNLGTAPDQFDVVWSQGLVEHFPNPEVLVREHLKVCKQGGIVLVSVPYKYSYMYPWYIITRPKMMRRFWPWTDQDFYTKNKFEGIMAELGYCPDDFKMHRVNPMLGYIILRVVKKGRCVHNPS